MEYSEEWETAEQVDIVLDLDTVFSNRKRHTGKSHQQVLSPISRTLYYDSNACSFSIKNPLNEKQSILVSQSTVPIDQSTIGKQVLVVFDNGQLPLPIITGVIEPIAAIGEEKQVDDESANNVSNELLLSAKKQITLKCGESSITMTSEGKVLIKGKFLSSRSTGINRIKGAAVSIN